MQYTIKKINQSLAFKMITAVATKDNWEIKSIDNIVIFCGENCVYANKVGHSYPTLYKQLVDNIVMTHNHVFSIYCFALCDC